MALDKNHSLIKDFKGSLKRLYRISSLSDISKWVADQVKNYNFNELAEIMQHKDMEHHVLYRVSFFELAKRKGMIHNWVIGPSQDNKILLIDVYMTPKKYVSYECRL